MNRWLDSIGFTAICRLTPSRRIKDNLFAFRNAELLAHRCLFILISKPQRFITRHATNPHNAVRKTEYI